MHLVMLELLLRSIPELLLCYRSARESARYPGEASDEAGGKRFKASGSNKVPSHSALPLEDALFLLCPLFSHEVFYTVTSFIEASGDTGFHCFYFAAIFCHSHCSELYSLFPSFLLSLSPSLLLSFSPSLPLSSFPLHLP